MSELPSELDIYLETIRKSFLHWEPCKVQQSEQKASVKKPKSYLSVERKKIVQFKTNFNTALAKMPDKSTYAINQLLIFA